MKRSFSMICALGCMLAAPAWADGSGDCDGNGQVDAAGIQAIGADIVTVAVELVDIIRSIEKFAVHEITRQGIERLVYLGKNTRLITQL